MGVRAVLAEVTLLLQLKVLANLGLVVVVRYVKHLVLNFDGQLLKKAQIIGVRQQEWQEEKRQDFQP